MTVSCWVILISIVKVGKIATSLLLSLPDTSVQKPFCLAVVAQPSAKGPRASSWKWHFYHVSLPISVTERCVSCVSLSLQKPSNR